MCDYSLESIASRPAKVGDRLMTTKFPNSITGGFTAVGEPHVAVCLRPGTEIAFEKDAECDAAFRFFPHKRLGARVARFRQINLDWPTAHHDAIEFPDGQTVLVTSLCAGQYATVLQLPHDEQSSADEHDTSSAETVRHDPIVA
jgi:hypothetical protein